MFMPNDVFSWCEKRIRILWVNQQAIFWIDIDDDRALPQLAKKSDFEHLVARYDLKRISDPYINFSMASPIDRILRDKSLFQIEKWLHL